MPRFEDYVNAVYQYLEAHMPFEKGSIVALRPTSILKESKLPQNPASLAEINYILNLLTMAIDADVIERDRGRLYMFRKSDLAEIVKLGRDGFWIIVNILERLRQRGPKAPSPKSLQEFLNNPEPILDRQLPGSRRKTGGNKEAFGIKGLCITL